MSTRVRLTGPGRILVAVYAVLAVAATGRSGFQIVDRFAEAPVAFSLSAVAAVVYILATLALALRLDRLAWITIGFELLGVLVVGTLTLVAPAVVGLEQVDLLDRAFGRQGTVWALYGLGYLGVPLAIPVIGLLYLARSRRATTVAVG
jgi:cytochrome bd-type quinol oxidase subunit 2